ncbi:Rgg/GadR/MutR family transcriptional regulator [Streptococcus pneumoniae]
MKSLGEIFKEIRTSRHMSLTEAAGEVCSKSMLSRFESGNHDIGAQKLVALLDNIHTDMEEFIFLCRSYQVQPDKKIFKQIEQALDVADTSKLHQLYQQEKDLYQTNKQEIHMLNALNIKARMKGIDPKNVHATNEEMDFLYHYLFSIEHWGNYELRLFSTCTPFLSPKLYTQYVKEMLKRVDTQNAMESHRDLIHSMLLNGFLLCIGKNDRELARYFDEKIQEHFYKENETYLRAVYLFAKGMFVYKFEDLKQGKKLMTKALTVFDMLDCKDSLFYYQQAMEGLVKNESHSF